MPEAKNTFLKAKMNQDLDDRLLPNGEYRTAQNILVGKSEEDSVGAIENIKGNAVIPSTELVPPYSSDTVIIGYYMDSTNDRIYTFITDHFYAGQAPPDAHCSIRCLDVNNPSNYSVLVEGSFLNFSASNNIIAVNILEDLLFWTDNRNQPRKINVTTALREGPSHYYKENHISVAKYNPYQPISLIKEEIEEVISVNTTTEFDVAENTNIEAGMTVLAVNSSGSSTILPYEYITVVSAVASTTPGQTTITISSAPSTPIATTDTIYFIVSTMTDKSNISTWPGDPDYLEEKFVRFAYRFKFEDGEYSIFSPFTQIAFVPKQKGYFINGQEDSAVKSTILNWFENNINNIELIIPLPDSIDNIVSSYKIREIDILYKESDQIPVKVVDSITLSGLTGTDNFYIYNYQSRKPIRTLPEGQTTRVYDKVPVKAFGQEIVGNRVVYSNFQTKHTPPRFINYNINVQTKLGTGKYPNFIEYPNHTVKQNRNYQVGFVLSDKFGRQSDVILSSVQGSGVDVAGTFFAGSTIYNEYIQDEPAGSGVPDPGDMPDGVIDWLGSSLVMAVNTPITSTKTENSTPGLYAEEAGRFDLLIPSSTTITDSTYTFEIDPAGNINIPAEGEYLRGDTQDYVLVTNVVNTSGNIYEVTTNGRVNNLYAADSSNPVDTKFSYNINALGWYSYKIVVKQTEQEYYNVYLPSAIAAGGFMPNSSDTDASVSYITLINDNINKVPRDLAEVGPDQKQYRSSVKLFGRVRPTGSHTTTFGNTQFYPFRSSDISTSVGNTDDLLGTNILTEDAVFQYDSDPIIARVSTEKQFGINHVNFGTTQVADRFQLAVYETEPIVSNLDIYWETASAGLISDLNWDVNVGFDGPVALQDTNFTFLENNPEKGQPGNQNLTGTFYPLNNTGGEMQNTTLGSYTVTNGLGADVTSDFEISQVPSTGVQPGSYYVQHLRPFTYEYGSENRDVFTFELEITDPNPSSSWGSVMLSFTGSLTNVTPSFSVPAPPYYYFDSTFIAGQTIHNFTDSSNNALNGSADPANNTVGFRWRIASGNDDGYFALDQNTGVLTLTSAGLQAGIGTYTLTIQLCDAADNGALDGDSICVTQSVGIIKGYPRTNIEESTGNSTTWYYDGTQPASPDKFIYECYYIADQVLAASDLPHNGNTDFTNTLFYKDSDGNPVGNLARGEFGVRFDGSIYHSGTQILNPIYTDVTISAYHRATSGDAWTLIADSNGDSLDPEINIANDVNDSTPFTYRTYFAQNTPGQYAFLITIDNSNSFDDIEGELYIDLFDLHYTGAGQVQHVYRYDLFTNNGSGYTSLPTSCLPPSGSSDAVYSEVPIAEYVREFYDSEDLDQIYTPPSGNKFYISELQLRQLPSVIGMADEIAHGPAVLGSGQSSDTARGVIKLKSDGKKDSTVSSLINAKKGYSSSCSNGAGNNRTQPLIQ